MSAALQIYYTRFDAALFKLPPNIRRLIEGRIDEMGLRLGAFPHHRLTGSNRFRLRVGDYRVIYTFDASQNVIHLLAVGHRREIYRTVQDRAHFQTSASRSCLNKSCSSGVSELARK